MTTRFTRILVLALLITSPSFSQKKKSKAEPANTKPNIVLIMADDLGFSDIGSYGSEIQTPNLDKLAAEGIRFRQFYNNAICAPTRASLLSGQYQHTAGMGYFNINLGTPAYQGFLSKQTVSLAEVLKDAGYSTLMSGKWHVGDDSTSQWPRKRGFDHFYGNIGGASDYYVIKNLPKKQRSFFVKDDKVVDPEDEDNFYYTDEIAKNAIGFLKDQLQEQKPFFLYLAFTSPHWPLQAWPKDIKKYEGKYDIGWDSLRILRFKRQQELNILGKGQKISIKNSDLPAWNSLTYDEQKLWAKKMEVYAAQVDNLDQNIGKVIDHLKESGQLDNTIIFFISDNGAAGEDVGHGFSGRAVRNWGPVGTAGSYDSYTRTWAYASNTPLKSFKGFQYEGGISSPFIARFPSKIAAGGLIDGTAHLIDIAPTLYEIAGARYPQNYKGNTIHPLAGESILPAIYGKEWTRSKPIFWERAGNKAVRKGKWKLVSVRSDLWELYDIESDRGETSNVIKDHADVAAELKGLYDTWAKSVKVEDWNVIGKGKGFEPSFNP
ncbi:arylsulfatase [Dyadobacter sp. CY356]|uniref:arylsulfatase n=1 Tax=Dyadobacter sp. CY356 TaxID=2906442 RepID=UPI001F16C6F4|nr:arylsulfatase [Dyadobacter sp. CY356]MCF0055417.1 arylsulfatase [Dyadobacter sp. CY356]